MKLHLYHEDMAVVGACILTGRPVKFAPTGIESFVSDIHARDHRVRARMPFAGRARCAAMDVDDLTGVGAFSTYPRTSVVEGNQVVRLIGAPYRIRDLPSGPDVVARTRCRPASIAPSATRSPARSPNGWSISRRRASGSIRSRSARN